MLHYQTLKQNIDKVLSLNTGREQTRRTQRQDR